MNKIRSLVVLFSLALLAACATSSPYRSVRVVDVKPNLEKPAQPPYKKVLVGVLIKSPARKQLEQAIANQLRAQGLKARGALQVLGHESIDNRSRAYLAKKLEKRGFDGAIGIHLLHKKIENVKVAGTSSAPVPAGAGISMKAEPLGPDFSLNESTYVTKINFYDVKRQAIVWSATSVSHNPNGVVKGSRQFAKAIVSQLSQAGLFKP